MLDAHNHHNGLRDALVEGVGGPRGTFAKLLVVT